MGKHAVALGATTFAFFTRNPRGGKAKPIQKEDVAAFLAYAAEHDLQHLVAHAPYTMNLCSGVSDTGLSAGGSVLSKSVIISSSTFFAYS